MLTKDAIKFYRTKYKIAKALGVSRQYVYQWGDVVPFRCASKIERLSKGVVKVQTKLYE